MGPSSIRGFAGWPAAQVDEPVGQPDHHASPHDVARLTAARLCATQSTFMRSS